MTVPPPPPIIAVTSPANPRVVEIERFAPGPVTCDGKALAGAVLVAPMPNVVSRFRPASPSQPLPVLRYVFTIAANGQPGTIRPDASPAEPLFYLDRSDLAPSIAASRFAAGQRRTCAVDFATSLTPVADVPLQTLYALASRPGPLAAPPEVYDRIRPSGSTCVRGPGQFRALNNPAFETIAVPPGDWAWAFFAFDVMPDGTPRNVRLLGSSGTTALDRAGEHALARNRYAPGTARIGCLYHYFRVGSRPAVPADFPADTPPGTDDTIPACRIDPKTISGLLSGQAYPRAFQRRRIEGVAAVRYDTAPWGAIGNVRVLASEPAAAFGETAVAALTSAAVLPSETGYRGCVTRVRFRLPAGTHHG